ncbi:MAG: FimV/HubP family polar landmark protein [Methylovulum sp.]|nr:FimV/HubP family polar landmark protein [Methylovulum sp.]
MRNLTKTLAVVSLLIPASAYPLGIGEIKLHSALNQNLDAEISLVLSPGEKLSDIKVNLAPPDKFDENGVPWTYFLSKIKFEPAGANGSAVIKISSKEALKEPLLEFLLEVSWPKGSLYRGFTVLVDPPDVYKQAAMPAMSNSSDEFEARQDTISEPYAKRRPLATDERASAGAGGYGPTSRNDTLWKIAEQLRDADVSIEQMLIALYQENPHAFYKANINALLAGKTLKVPDKNVILKWSRKQAVSEFNRQIQIWNKPETRAAVADTGQHADADNQLTLEAPAQEPVSEHASLTSGHGQQAAADKKAASPASLTSETGLPIADQGAGQKSAGSSAAVDNTIESKVAALEKQLAMMRELISLKDQQLAALQNQTQATPVGQAAPLEGATAKPGATAPIDIVANKPEAAAPIGGGASKPELAAPGIQPKAELQPKPLTPKPVVKPAARPAINTKIEEEDSFDGYYWGVGGAGIALLVALGWLWWRQRQLGGMDDAGSPSSSAGFAKTARPADVFSSSADDNNYGIDLTLGDNIFASDFAAGDFDVIDMDQGEIDPISEADVYLAYGRYQQAEDLMRDAIADQPERDECKLKLLEIFYANGNKQGFETYVGELVDAGKQDDPNFWAKVTEMGSDICADSPLFSSGINSRLKKNTGLDGGEASSASADEAVSDESDMDFDLASFEKLFDSSAAQELFGEKNDMFDIGITPVEHKPEAIVSKNAPEQNNESIDFDLSLFDVDTPVPTGADKVEKPAAVTETNNEFEAFDFDLSLFAVDTPATKEADKAETLLAETKDGLDSYDFDFGVNDDKEKITDELSVAAAHDGNYHAIDFSDDKTAGFDEIRLEKGDQDLYDGLTLEDALEESYPARSMSVL